MAQLRNMPESEKCANQPLVPPTFPKSIVANNVSNLHSWNHAVVMQVFPKKLYSSSTERSQTLSLNCVVRTTALDPWLET